MARTFSLYRFTVRGRGRFPMDMLRYDECFPAHPDDVRAMNADSGQRSVRLVTRRRGGPTEGRWDSFGWPVIDSTIERAPA